MKASGSSQGAATALTIIGVVLVAAFFAPWIDVAGQLKHSGWWLASHEWSRLYLVPVLGAALIAAGATRSRYLPLVAALAALVIVGTTAYYTVKSVFHLELGVATTVVGGALVLAGISDQRRALRAVGGALALAGFFMAWGGHDSGFDIVRNHDPILDHLGVTFFPMWIIPLGALAAIGATVAAKQGRVLAGASGVGIIGGFLWFLYSIVNLVAGWGAWVTLGGGVAAGIVAVVAAAGQSSATR